MSEIENVNVEKEEKEVVSRNFIEQIIDRNPELIFNRDMMSDIAIKLFMSVFSILIF